MRRHETILILDFGGQYTQLIARKVREQSVYCEILAPGTPASALRDARPKGIILSGGPDSVYAAQAPQADPEIFALGVPVLGICYGMQLMVHRLGGQVKGAGRREYGHAVVRVVKQGDLLAGLGPAEQVWMSHGDEITALPPGFQELARTEAVPFSAAEDPSRRLHAVAFHPEVAHTTSGQAMLRNFLFRICGCAGDWTMASFLEEACDRIRSEVGPRGRVLCGLSGGVDSSVAAQVIHRAIGDRLICLFVDTGLLRKGEAAEVLDRFARTYHLRVRHRDASSRFYQALQGVTDPETKRRTIGEVFVRVFEEEARAAAAEGPIRFLGQGTLYPDLIESRSVRGPSATIKTHHNVGGLPERMDLEVVEPLKELFKDEVRRLAAEMGMDRELIVRHPFPGPGLAVRILGEVTPERIAVLQDADAVFLDELRTAGLYDDVAQAFAVLLPVRSVGVMGDGRTYENVLALRAVETTDFMTADWSRLPHEFLARVSTRIVNEVRGVNRVVYDISSKPPSTIEWE
ncbi:MAG TPA: glutamine-hydrolyzing GMP synthase [Candidatus Polarisedimenticolia bacterium]|nr:glutamine-hydrolyzing GMP synthase [Candidatus Polarisedimenticolia bacterium]